MADLIISQKLLFSVLVFFLSFYQKSHFIEWNIKIFGNSHGNNYLTYALKC